MSGKGLAFADIPEGTRFCRYGKSDFCCLTWKEKIPEGLVRSGILKKSCLHASMLLMCRICGVFGRQFCLNVARNGCIFGK